MTDTDFERQPIAHFQQPKKMKFKENQEVFIVVENLLSGEAIETAKIVSANSYRGIYEVFYIGKSGYNQHLDRGSEAIFETSEQAQQHLESIKI